MKRYYICSYMDRDGFIAGNQAFSYDGDFDLGEAHNWLTMNVAKPGSYCIIISWQEISESQFRSYAKFCDELLAKLQGKPKVAPVIPLGKPFKKDGPDGDGVA